MRMRYMHATNSTHLASSPAPYKIDEADARWCLIHSARAGTKLVTDLAAPA